MTSSFLDSHAMLGINGKEQDRINVQIRVTCSPVHVKDISQLVNIGSYTFLKLYLGPTLNNENNYTYLYNLATDKTGVGYLLEYDYISFAIRKSGGTRFKTE